MVKLVVCDLDGTIINRYGQCDVSVVKTVKRLREKGIKFAICTGRPVIVTKNLIKGWGLDGEVDYLVGSNGGEILDLQTLEKEITYTLEPEILLEIIEQYEPLGIVPTYYADSGVLYVQREIEEVKTMCARTETSYEIKDVQSFITGPQIKDMFVVPVEKMPEIIAYYQEHLDDRYIGFQTAEDLFEFNHPLLAKDVGVKAVAEKEKIGKDEIMAFGDLTNDIEMLSYVKYGIAMGNASDDAKAIAYDICDTIDEQGFAKYIHDHVLKEDYSW